MMIKNVNEQRPETIFELLKQIDSKLDSICRPVMQPVWLNSKEAAKVLGVTTRTLQSYRDQNLIPFSQFGREVRFRAEDLQEFLFMHYVKPKNWKKAA